MVGAGVALTGAIVLIWVVWPSRDRDKAELVARNEAVLQALPVYPGATERSPVVTRKLTEGDPIARTIGYLSSHEYNVPSSRKRVQDFYSAWLRARGWRGTDQCDAFFVRGVERLEVISCTTGRVLLRSRLHFRMTKGAEWPS
jgi:hypothetical protein